MKTRYLFIAVLLILSGWFNQAEAQGGLLRRAQGGFGGGGGGKADSVIHRTGLEDSLTIRFRYLDSSRLRGFDSSITDFYERFPTPWHSVNLGNLGTPARNLIFTPRLKPGFDAGFHALDNYLYNAEETKFYTTTRPFSEADYVLGARSEQFIQLTHTQNIRPNWNAGFQYRLINSPGLFQNQAVNHNNYRFHSWYQSKNKRYQNFFVIVGNKMQAGENGGIKTDVNYLDSAAFSERSTIPVNLGPDMPNSRNFFTTSIGTGSFLTTGTYMMRQQYDIGQKDSMIVNDTSVVKLFYPRLRLEHTIRYDTYKYRFRDAVADSAYYSNVYNIFFNQYTASGDKKTGNWFTQDYWKVLTNDFSIYQFPDARNPHQFIKVGAAYESLDFLSVHGDQKWGRIKDNNLYLHGEYRNQTKNKKWDIEANGNFYVNGMNSGNYTAYLSLQRLLSKKVGYLQVGFQNTNRTPSFVFDFYSGFNRVPSQPAFNKENITNIFGSVIVPSLKMKLSANYYLISNLAYFKEMYKPDQATTPFNILQITAEKQFKVAKHWNWRTWIVLQQRAGDGPVNMPLFTTRNQFAYDGNLGFKNLLASMGVEFRYYTAYNAENYSPLMGQYTYQNAAKIKLKMPDISAFIHFRIRTFTAYIRAENLNALKLPAGTFTNNNIPTFNYPYPGLQIRVGIFWSFIN
ncbi:putative porin [Pseudoflavitalea sp. G-6-1-2]|uniref:putative porin n=1 Tax=Pseudoflavitalea sp. G-6-1-2 TaxID=2728841 RepID=UPI00146F155E|nr:putative porin [Pseudoflavitalea sp. G-6-1-2]NML22157.1 putative porin [Pseudoflavitalea sp. G-6-1-2]